MPGMVARRRLRCLRRKYGRTSRPVFMEHQERPDGPASAPLVYGAQVMYHRRVSNGRRDPYEVIGVSRGADTAEIKNAFRQRAMQYHPDRNPGDKAAEERFKELSEAYALLRDPESRARYDRYGHAVNGTTPTHAYTGEQWREMFNEAEIPIDWTRMTSGGSTGNAMFDALFGMVTGMLRGSGLLPGETREVVLDLDLGEAV